MFIYWLHQALVQHVGSDHAAKWSPIKQLTGTDEAAGRRCLSGLQVLIKSLTDADLASDVRCSIG